MSSGLMFVRTWKLKGGLNGRIVINAPRLWGPMLDFFESYFKVPRSKFGIKRRRLTECDVFECHRMFYRFEWTSEDSIPTDTAETMNKELFKTLEKSMTNYFKNKGFECVEKFISSFYHLDGGG